LIIGPPQDGNAAAGRWNGDLLTAELAFRLAMLQQQYPQYISDDMVHDWSHQAEQVRCNGHSGHGAASCAIASGQQQWFGCRTTVRTQSRAVRWCFMMPQQH